MESEVFFLIYDNKLEQVVSDNFEHTSYPIPTIIMYLMFRI